MEKIIGREIEQKQLKNIIESNDAELLSKIFGIHGLQKKKNW